MKHNSISSKFFYSSPRICLLILEREQGRERERGASVDCPPQPMTHVLCYDLTAAVTSLGNRNSSAPLSSYGATITLGPSTDWNAMLHLTVVTLLQSLEYPIRVSHPIFNWFTFLCNSVGFQKKKEWQW